jgi:hypothetical protein
MIEDIACFGCLSVIFGIAAGFVVTSALGFAWLLGWLA